MHYYRPTRMQRDRDYGQRSNDLWNSSLSVMTTDRWSCWRMDLAAAAARQQDSVGSTQATAGRMEQRADGPGSIPRQAD